MSKQIFLTCVLAAATVVSLATTTAGAASFNARARDGSGSSELGDAAAVPPPKIKSDIMPNPFILGNSAFSEDYHFSTNGDDNPIVNVTGGMIQGTHDKYSYYFKGVPFAAPPVGALRFLDPQPLQPWDGVLNTTQPSAGCYQRCVLPRPAFTCPDRISEDCLYLNVFTPTVNSSAKLPVMAWIHGGAFLAGAGGTLLYEASQFAQKEQMVIVTSNYRLGAFGALYNGEGMKGNMQLKDQRVVLQWIQDNIHTFGGDKTHVTIAGQSAGAMSVGCHLASPKSHQYFKAAIMSSNPFGLMMSNKDLMKWLHDKVADQIKCPRTNSLACFQAVDAETLLNVSLAARYWPLPNYALASVLPWVPLVTEDDELPMQPLYAANGTQSTVPKKVNVMMGTVAQDGLYFVYEAIEKDLSYWVVRLLLQYIFNTDIANHIEKFYGKYADASQMHEWVGKVLTDYLFYCPNRFYARAMSQQQNSTVYGWYLGQLPSFAEWIWGNSVAAKGCVTNVCHSDDLPYIFRANLYSADVPNPTAAEDVMVDMIQDAFGTFIKTEGRDILPPNSTSRMMNIRGKSPKGAANTLIDKPNTPFTPIDLKSRLEEAAQYAVRKMRKERDNLYRGETSEGTDEAIEMIVREGKLLDGTRLPFRRSEDAGWAEGPNAPLAGGDGLSVEKESPFGFAMKAMRAAREGAHAVERLKALADRAGLGAHSRRFGAQSSTTYPGPNAYTPWPPMYRDGANNLQLDWLAPTSVLMEGFRDDICDYFDSVGYNRY